MKKENKLRLKKKMVKIKKAKRWNFGRISKFYMEEFSKPPFNEMWTNKKALKKIKLFSKYCDIWEIWYSEKLIGFIIINPNQWCSGEIIFREEMAIQKKFQRGGIGVEVFLKILEHYKKLGFKKYFGIVDKSSKSFGMHKKVGASQNKENILMEIKL